MGRDFCARVGIEIPIVQAPMAGSGGIALAIAVAQAGGAWFAAGCDAVE